MTVIKADKSKAMGGWGLALGLLVGMIGLGGVAGCKAGKEVRPGAMVEVPVGVVDAGSLVGVVRFLGKVPAAVRMDMSLDPGCGGAGAGAVYAEQYVVHEVGSGAEGGAKEQRLGNVFVYVKSGPVAGAASGARNAVSQVAGGAESGTAVVVDQVGCRYTPHVVGVMRGGVVEFRNSDNTMHNIHTMPLEGKGVNVGQAAMGKPMVVKFDTAELMVPVRCDVHPWMNAFVNVVDTPFFAVTDAEGRFSLKGLPPGEYVLGAVHEKLGEQTLKVTVTAKQTSKAEFQFAMQ